MVKCTKGISSHLFAPNFVTPKKSTLKSKIIFTQYADGIIHSSRLMGTKKKKKNATNPMVKYTSCLFARVSFASDTKKYDKITIGKMSNGCKKSK